MNLTYNARNSWFSTPPYAYWDRWFSKEKLEEIQNYCSGLSTTPGMIGSLNSDDGHQTALRNSSISFIKYEDSLKWLFDDMFQLTETINRNFFRYDITGFDYLQYTEYNDKGSHYDYHTDMIFGDNLSPHEMMPRKLSFSLILSDPCEYEGGNLELLTGKDEVLTPEQKYGRIIAFPSFILHRVTPIQSGRRKSLVFWALGPKFK